MVPIVSDAVAASAMVAGAVKLAPFAGDGRVSELHERIAALTGAA